MRDSFERLWRTLLAVAICTAAMAVLVTGIAFALGTTAHDWYAAGKVTLAEALVAVGFDEFALTEYRRADGETLRISRFRLTIGEAWAVRAELLSMAADRAVLGACTGIVVAMLCLWVGRAVWPSPAVPADVVPRPAAMRGPYRPAWPAGAGSVRPAAGGERTGLLVVSEAEFESLLRRTGGIGPSGTAPAAGGWPPGSPARQEALPAGLVQALPPADAPEQPGGKAGEENPGPESGTGDGQNFY